MISGRERGHSARTSKIQLDLALRPGTADQHIAVCGRFERFGIVADRPADQGALAGVTDASPARPLHRNVAGFGKFQQTPVCRTPRRIEAASGEGDLRAGTGRVPPVGAAAQQELLEIPGVTASSGPNTSWCNRSRATPQLLRSSVNVRRNPGGPHR